MAPTTVFLLVFRVLHIGAGVAWAGSAFLFVVLIQPSAAAIGPAASPFMLELLGRRKLVSWLLGLGAATILGGLALYVQDANAAGGLGPFVSTTFGTVLLVGAAAAIAAFLVGLVGTRPNARRLLALVGQAAAAGAPRPEIGAEIARVQARLKTLARISLALIAVAVFAMATARTW